MGNFLESEKIRQAAFKKTSTSLSEAARLDGEFRGAARPFCLPQELSLETLYPPIRNDAISFYKKHGILWHQGINDKPSNHLCDSMTCCANFLFPFCDQPDVLKALLKPFFPDIERVLPVEDNRFVSFEWIGAQNYLGERMGKNGERSRGANFTSTDAIVAYQRQDGSKQIVLIEWKYTESYSSASLKIAKSGTDRSLIYRHLFEKEDCVINKDLLPSYSDIFYEPFYQFFRQQSLAHEMEKAGELNADNVCLLHIAPENNYDFRKVTSPGLRQKGSTAIEVWKSLLREPSRFISLGTKQLFADFDYEPMRAWKAYILERYPGIFA